MANIIVWWALFGMWTLLLLLSSTVTVVPGSPAETANNIMMPSFLILTAICLAVAVRKTIRLKKAKKTEETNV